MKVKGFDNLFIEKGFDDEERIVFHGHQNIGKIYYSWLRLGGWGWSISTSAGQTYKSQREAATTLWRKIKRDQK